MTFDDELLQHHALRGIAIGRCVDGSAIRDRDGCAIRAGDGFVQAHAHISASDRRHGWICLVSLRSLTPTTIRHELAHIIVGTDAHRLDEPGGEAWQRMVRKLGGRIERRYLLS